MSVCMHKYIDHIVDVKYDGSCNYHAISALPSKEVENHTLVCRQLLKELKAHK